MISKKKLKERLLDICAGAGYHWQEEDDYFDSDEGTLSCLSVLIPAIEIVFNIPQKSRLVAPWRLTSYEHIDTLVDLVYETLIYDTNTKGE